MSRRGAYAELLRSNLSFRRLWIAQLISLGGDWFNVVAGLLGRNAAFVANAASFLVAGALILGVRAHLGPLGSTGVSDLSGGRRRRLRPIQDLAEGGVWARNDARVMALLAQKVGFGL